MIETSVLFRETFIFSKMSATRRGKESVTASRFSNKGSNNQLAIFLTFGKYSLMRELASSKDNSERNVIKKLKLQWLCSAAPDRDRRPDAFGVVGPNTFVSCDSTTNSLLPVLDLGLRKCGSRIFLNFDWLISQIDAYSLLRLQTFKNVDCTEPTVRRPRVDLYLLLEDQEVWGPGAH